MAHYFLLILLFLGSCNYQNSESGKINIIINPDEHGWYFVELIEDATVTPSVINVKIDSALQLKKITVANYNQYAFKVTDKAGVDISSKMKLPAHLSHHTGRHFFKFYNPSKKDLAKVIKWNTTDIEYQAISAQAKKQLERLLE